MIIFFNNTKLKILKNKDEFYSLISIDQIAFLKQGSQYEAQFSASHI